MHERFFFFSFPVPVPFPNYQPLNQPTDVQQQRNLKKY